MREIWKPIKGFKGYEVSNTGKVKRMARKVNFGFNRIGVLKEKVLEGTLNQQGYLVVCLRKNNRNHVKYIHRLVAEAFIPNPDHLSTVIHKDKCKTNNNATNLDWRIVGGLKWKEV